MEYPRLKNFRDALKGNMVIGACARTCDLMRERHGDAYLRQVENTLALGEKMAWNSLDALTAYMVDYLREQAYFSKHGDYGHADFDAIKDMVYGNREVMSSYLPGLFLSYSFSSLMCEKYHFFRKRMLPAVSGRVLDIGFGEGFYLWSMLALDRREAGRIDAIAGVDISPFAVEFARDVLGAAGISVGCDLREGDVVAGIDMDSGSVDCVLLAEVVEHLPHPEKAIDEAERLLARQGFLYLATVLDSNHVDHITNFADAREVEAMIGERGFSIEHRLEYRLDDDFPASRDRSVGLAYVCRKN